MGKPSGKNFAGFGGSERGGILKRNILLYT
jgi:hypothetical protein